MTDLMLVFASALAAARLMVEFEWAPAVALAPRRPAEPQGWMTGPGAYEALVAGGVRALLDRSPMRYDVAVYLGGGS